MKRGCIFIFLLGMLSCSSPAYEFEPIPCESSPTISNDNRRHIFKPCREHIYRARFWDRNFNLISDEYLLIMATGRVWEYDGTQDEVAIQYRPNFEEVGIIHEYSINPEYEREWREGEVTGIIETASVVWMNPIRSNQYIFTEVAGFPFVMLPLEVGKQWSTPMSVYEGWGRWSNTTIEQTYRVVDREQLENSFETLDTWHIATSAVAPFGTSTHDFWFNEDFGFVKMTIRNYEGQLLTFELVDVRSPNPNQ